MNPFAIFLMIFFYISCAPAQAQRKEYCRLGKAIIFHRLPPPTEPALRTFNEGKVYLYSIGITGRKFSVGDESGGFSEEFEIKQNNTAVTGEKITIKWWYLTVSLFFIEDTFAFYKRLFRIKNFSYIQRQYTNVTKVEVGETIWEEEFVIKVNEDERLFVALHGDEPRLILPKNCSTPVTNQNPNQVSFDLQSYPSVGVTLEFGHRTDAITFKEFIRDLQPVF